MLPFTYRMERRIQPVAGFLCQRAARMKTAARRQVDGVRWIALQNDPLCGACAG